MLLGIHARSPCLEYSCDEIRQHPNQRRLPALYASRINVDRSGPLSGACDFDHSHGSSNTAFESVRTLDKSPNALPAHLAWCHLCTLYLRYTHPQKKITTQYPLKT